MKLNKCTQLIAAAMLLAASASGHAGLIADGMVDLKGTGLGSVNTVLTLQNNNRTGIADGSIKYNGSTDVRAGDAHPAQNSTYSFDFLNITDLQDLILVFNPSEPGNTDANKLTLETLNLLVFSMDGTVKYNIGLEPDEIFYGVSETGTGGSGFGFIVNPLDAAREILGTDRIGLEARLSNANAGLDTFFVIGLDDDGEGPGNEIPEPGSIALLGLGIAGMTALRRRYRKA